jgi:hypothetical protein
MGIDRIGSKGPPAPPVPHAASVGRAAEAARPFDVHAPASAASRPAAETPAAEPTRTALQRLQAGEIDLGGYLDLKAREATAHLTALPAPELDALRSAMRDRMASDPTLVELVRTATGRLPDPPSDE